MMKYRMTQVRLVLAQDVTLRFRRHGAEHALDDRHRLCSAAAFKRNVQKILGQLLHQLRLPTSP
jgi:hypothetical protein